MRPHFLNRPEVWTRTARTVRTPAEYASAIEHVERSHRIAERVVAWLAVLFLLLIVVGVMR